MYQSWLRQLSCTLQKANVSQGQGAAALQREPERTARFRRGSTTFGPERVLMGTTARAWATPKTGSLRQ